MSIKTDDIIYPRLKGFWLILIICVVSCRSDNNATVANGITGEWRLIEVLADPGDGSGQFTPVDSQKQISILEHGTFFSNGEPCNFSIEAISPTEGTILEDGQGYYLECEAPWAGIIRLSVKNEELIITFF
ncbi:MAG: hypothetical protein WBN59_01130 [Flavobacteriaceae bacterium]